MNNHDWNASLSGEYLWSNTNFGEAFSQAMTPLTWSVLQFTLHDWVFLPGYSTVGNIAGWPYLNISIFATLYHLMNRTQQDLLSYMEATLFMQLPEEVSIPLIRVPKQLILPAFWGLVKLRLRQQQGIRRLPTYLHDTPAWFERMRIQLAQTANRGELLRLWEAGIRSHILDGVWTVLGTASDSADYTLSLRRSLTPLVGEQDAGWLIANLSREGHLLASLQPLVALEEVAQGKMKRSEYLARYGHRGPDEFELSKPRPAEQAEWLEKQITRFQTNPVEISNKVAVQQDAFRGAWERFSARFPSQGKRMQSRIAESARRNRLREQARSEYVRDRWLIRLFALRAAELCQVGEDVFYLRLEEVLSLLAGDKSALQSLPERREAYARLRALPNPPAVILGRFDPFAWAKDPLRSTDFYDARRQAPAVMTDSHLIKGAPGSAGVVEGRVRRLDTPDQVNELQNGEVLVTAMTDISWTLLFPRLGAVVTDVGAPLSHAAIVARELGIPAVVGCGDATRRLHTGERVRVDGGKGIVERVD